MRPVCVSVALVAMVTALPSWADEKRPDFLMAFKQCKALGVAAQPGEPRLAEAREYTLVCWRSSQEVSCLFRGDGEEKPIHYTVDADIPPLLTLVQGQNAGDFISINTERHSASSMTRMLLAEGGLVAKVCSGVFATADELEAIRASEPRPQPSSTPADAQRVTPAIAPKAVPAPASEPARSCCKVCTQGCPCGDSCIACSKTCRKGQGCAC